MAGKPIVFALVLIFVVVSDGLLAPEEELVVHFKQFKPCEGVEDPILKYETLGVNHVGKDTYQMFGNLVSEEELGGKLKFVMEVEKCQESGISSTCERALTYKIDDLCADNLLPTSMARGFIEDSGIPPKCPFPPGNYTLEPKTIGLDETTKRVVRSGKYWKLATKIIKVDGKNEKVDFCFSCEGKVDKKEDDKKTRQRKAKGK